MGRRDEEDVTPDDRGPRPEHLSEVEDGCGCVEVWERLSEVRENGGPD